MSPGQQEAAVDGRTARRDRNRDAVLDAAHDLFVEGELLPGIADVALGSWAVLVALVKRRRVLTEATPGRAVIAPA